MRMITTMHTRIYIKVTASVNIFKEAKNKEIAYGLWKKKLFESRKFYNYIKQNVGIPRICSNNKLGVRLFIT